MEKKFPAKMDQIEEMASFIQVSGKELGLEQSIISKIDLACEEALVNVVQYAYPESDGELKITVEGISEKPGVYIKIEDWGHAFNPLENAEPDITLPLEERQIGGLGIFLVKKVMDEVNYSFVNNSNVLEMKKYTA